MSFVTMVIYGLIIGLAVAILENIVSMFIVVKKFKCQSLSWVAKTFYIPCILYTISVALITLSIVLLDVSMDINKNEIKALVLFGILLVAMFVDFGFMKIVQAKRRNALYKCKCRVSGMLKDSDNEVLSNIMNKINNIEKRVRIDNNVIEAINKEIDTEDSKYSDNISTLADNIDFEDITIDF